MEAPPDYLFPRVVAKAAARRGRIHAFEALPPATTALVVIDMTVASVEGDDHCRDIVGPINSIAAALRARGGTVAWIGPAPPAGATPTDMAVAVFGRECAALHYDEAQPGGRRNGLFPALIVQPEDIQAMKSGASAFFPGKCDLPARLDARKIDTILIAGTVTNVCCESSARDAAELGYKVIMIADAMAGHAHGLHEATLNTFYRSFGDVRSAAEILTLLSAT